MADKKISALTASTTPLAGTEVLPIVQGGSTVKVSVANLTAGRAVTALSAATTTGYKNTSAGADTASTPDGLFLTDAANKNAIVQLSASGGVSTFIFESGGAGWRRVSGLLTNGNSVVDVGNVVIGTAAKGIDFSANTHAAGMTSELLNWYETGTWTATLTGSTTAPAIPVTATGYYTRVGNIVHVFASFANVSTVGALGDLQVTGLPFTSGASRAFGSAALDKFTLTGVQAFAAVYNGDNKVIFSENVNGGYGPNVAIPSTTGVYAQFSITYQV